MAPERLVVGEGEGVRHVLERELVGGEGGELVLPPPGEAGRGGELGLSVAAAVAEGPDDRSLLHHQALQVDRPRLAERAERPRCGHRGRPPGRRR